MVGIQGKYREKQSTFSLLLRKIGYFQIFLLLIIYTKIQPIFKAEKRLFSSVL